MNNIHTIFDLTKYISLSGYIVVLIPFTAAIVCLYYSLQALKRARTMEDVPISKIRSAAQGYVELNGVAKAFLNQPILGKLSRQPCVWNQYAIEELMTRRNEDGSSSQTWVTIDTWMSTDPFILNDGTGECIIFPETAEVDSKQYLTWQGFERFPSQGPITHSFWYYLFFGTPGNFRYIENRIELDTPLYVTGNFVTLMKEDPNIQNSPLLLNYLNVQEKSKLYLISGEGLSSYASKHIGYKKKKGFLVATFSQKQMSRTYRFKAFTLFVGFLIFSAAIVASSLFIVMNAYNLNNLQQQQNPQYLPYSTPYHNYNQ